MPASGTRPPGSHDAQPEFFAACAAADEATALRLLAADRSLATARDPELGRPSLLHVCDSPAAADTAALARIARALLEAGADPDTSVPQPGAPRYQLSALYHACVRGHAGVVRALLEHGANTQDGESIYHAAEADQRACLEVMLEFGADLSGRQQPFQNTPLYFLAGYMQGSEAAARAHSGMHWLLEHGADPNVTSGDQADTPLHQVARMGGGLAIAEALLAHGADPNAARTDGRTPYALAYRRGDMAMCEAMRAHGARPALTPIDEFLGAALGGDVEGARARLAADPNMLEHSTHEDHAVLVQLTAEGRLDAVALLVSLGFDLGREGAWGGTALHWAAWHGRVAMVEQLLNLGAPLEVRDRTYGSSPLAWAAHGSHHCRSADEDYLAIVKRLLEAGSGREASFNRWNEPPEALGSPRVRAYIEQWYREHPAGA